MSDDEWIAGAGAGTNICSRIRAARGQDSRRRQKYAEVNQDVDQTPEHTGLC